MHGHLAASGASALAGSMPERVQGASGSPERPLPFRAGLTTDSRGQSTTAVAQRANHAGQRAWGGHGRVECSTFGSASSREASREIPSVQVLVLVLQKPLVLKKPQCSREV